jgi:diguanylate cyclase (GGDEF)-like protein
MVASELVTDLARLIVVIAASVAAVPLVRRSADRRSTSLAIVAGIVLTLVPSALHLFQAMGHWSLRPPLTVLSRLDAPGFALILFGLMLGLRAMLRTGDELRNQNSILRREASTDFLTGLLNRRQADFLLDYGAARARRSGDPLGFIMIDLDHFKNVNDTQGHQAGDAVLVHVAQLIKSRMRGSDIVARYGGEEFLVVLADPNPEGTVTLADDLRRLVEQNPAEYGGRPIPVTASFGVAISLMNTEEAVQECIGKADAALYAAKALGRNRVVSWEQSFREADESARTLIQQACASRRPAIRSA